MESFPRFLAGDVELGRAGLDGRMADGHQLAVTSGAIRRRVRGGLADQRVAGLMPAAALPAEHDPAG